MKEHEEKTRNKKQETREIGHGSEKVNRTFTN
jgi:hypothetical protein